METRKESELQSKLDQIEQELRLQIVKASSVFEDDWEDGIKCGAEHILDMFFTKEVDPAQLELFPPNYS